MRAPVWVFDVDGCLIDSLTGSSLRPGSAELLAHLRDAGCSLVLWSAGGAVYALQRAEEHGVAAFFSAFHDKEGRDDAGRYVTERFLATLDAVVFVDDRPEDLPAAADVVAVAPYLVDNPHDRGLAPARRRAGLE
jgi:phosphoglycolate phosphatase-like HAD superfamily hydrolase